MQKKTKTFHRKGHSFFVSIMLQHHIILIRGLKLKDIKEPLLAQREVKQGCCQVITNWECINSSGVSIKSTKGLEVEAHILTLKLVCMRFTYRR